MKIIDGLNRAGRRSGSGGIAEIWQECLFSLLFRFANLPGLCMQTLFVPTHYVAVLAGNLNPISLQRLIRQPYIYLRLGTITNGSQKVTIVNPKA